MSSDSAPSRMIVGLGATGLATARYCARQGWDFDLCDSRDCPPGMDRIIEEFPGANIETGPLSAELLSQYEQLVVSPGIALATPAIRSAIDAGVEVIGDVELFLRANTAPVIAITGSNGKSTVTELVGSLLEQAGNEVWVGGNIGVPVLDLLTTDAQSPDYVVLELSSFQLETTQSVNAAAAVLLNLSEDHMDRYQGMDDYLAAKQRIFTGCRHVVINLDDTASLPGQTIEKTTYFGLSTPENDQFGLVADESGVWIVRGDQQLVHSSDISLKGRHNFANVMAALALIDACEVPLAEVIPALARFRGLDHRCQYVDSVDGVEFINDSKGTNVGSTLAAIEGLAADCSGTLHVLLGGEGKGQDFLPLKLGLQRFDTKTYVFGSEAASLARLFAGAVPCFRINTMKEAFGVAIGDAREGDIVLLSPACASFDQFKNYVARGEHFEALVRGMS